VSALRRSSVLLALVPLSAIACISVRYQARQSLPGDPATPATHAEGVTIADLHLTPGRIRRPDDSWARPTVTLAGLTTEAVADETNRTVLLAVRIAAGSEVEVLDMVWSPPAAPRCAGGHPALAILVDADGDLNSSLAERAQVHWERPVVLRGERVLSGRFDEDRPLLHGASVVDVRIARRGGGAAQEDCIRVPVTGPGVTFWNLKRWSIGGRLSWRRALRFTDSSVLLFGVSVGRWWGPVRIGVEAMGGGTNDNQDSNGAAARSGPTGTGLCFLASGPDCDNVTTGGLALEASGVAWRWDRWAVGWSLAYETLFARVRPIERHAIAGGPRLALQLLRAAPDVAGVSRHSPTSAWGFELYAAAGWEMTGAAAGKPITYGISLLGF
jgi:hypothetical protein